MVELGFGMDRTRSPDLRGDRYYMSAVVLDEYNQYSLVNENYWNINDTLREDNRFVSKMIYNYRGDMIVESLLITLDRFKQCAVTDLDDAIIQQRLDDYLFHREITWINEDDGTHHPELIRRR